MPSAYLALTLTSAIWGAASIVIKYTLQYLPPFTFLTYRFLVSFLVIIPFFIYYLRRHRITLSQFKEISFLNFIGIPFNLALVFIGINLTSALEASIILSIEPLLTVLGGAVFLKEKITRREIVGITVAIMGTLIVIIEPLLHYHDFTIQNLLGNLILLFSNFSLSYYTLRSKVDLHRKYSPWLITMIGFLIAPFFIFPLTILEQPVHQLIANSYQLPLSAHLGVWFMAIFSGIIAYFLYQYGLKRIDASQATIFHYLTNVFGIPLAVIWLHEKVTIPYLIGALIILAGVIIAETKMHRLQHSFFAKS